MSVTFRATPDQTGHLGGGDSGPTLNVSNVNARSLLRALGLVPELGVDDVLAVEHIPEPRPGGVGDDQVRNDLEGECGSADLIGRVDLALALSPVDAGVPWHALDHRTIDCGRRPGWLPDRLVELRAIAVYAHTRGRPVDWY